jgi:flagellar basal-body rod protein FlgB
MIDALFNQPNYVGAKKMLDATVLRHQAIANNLANLETPKYQRVDLAPSFQTELKRAVASNDASRVTSVQPSLSVDTEAVASNRDGNTVHLESELVQLNQNTLQHALEAQLITSSLVKLRLAITGKSS